MTGKSAVCGFKQCAGLRTHFATLKQCLFSCTSGKIDKAIDYNGKGVNTIGYVLNKIAREVNKIDGYVNKAGIMLMKKAKSEASKHQQKTREGEREILKCEWKLLFLTDLG